MPIVVGPDYEDAATYPLTHARIGYRNILPDADVSAPGASGFPVSSLLNPATYERWQPPSLPESILVDAGEPIDADYVGVAAHTLGSSECDITIEYSDDNDNWTEIDSAGPSNDDALMMLFETVTARYWRITVDGSTEPQIGVLHIGEVLSMARPIYGGHTPGKLNRKTTYQTNKSESGQFLGRSIVRRGYSESFDWSNLPASWYRSDFDPFVESARTTPFFIAWRPADFPSEVLYAWTTDDIAPTNSGTRDLMDVGISVEGLA